MRVLVDTSVWSLALRRKAINVDPLVVELRELIKESNAQIIGPIRQEVLSGIRNLSHYERLRDHLRSFHDFRITTQDYERAAEIYNLCRSKGVQGSNTDFLICAVAERGNMAVFTTDADFELFAKLISVRLHKSRGEG